MVILILYVIFFPKSDLCLEMIISLEVIPSLFFFSPQVQICLNQLLFVVIISCSKVNPEEFHKMKQKILNGRKQERSYDSTLCLSARNFVAQCQGTAQDTRHGDGEWPRLDWDLVLLVGNNIRTGEGKQSQTQPWNG